MKKPFRLPRAAEMLSAFLEGRTVRTKAARTALMKIRRLCEPSIAHIGLEVASLDVALFDLIGQGAQRFESVAIPTLYKGSVARVMVIPGTLPLELFEVRWGGVYAKRRQLPSISHIALRVKTEVGVEKIARLIQAYFPEIMVTPLLRNSEEGSVFFYAQNARGGKLEFVYQKS